MSIQFGDILQHNNLLYPIVDINDVKGGLRSIATFSSPALVSEYASIPEKYRSGYSLLLETSTGTIYYLAGVDPTNVSHWSPVGIGGNGYGVTNTIPKWTSSSILGNSNITDNGDTITINGNLMVIGTTSTISSENLLVKDPIILLAGSQSGTPTYDAGLFVNRGSSDTQAFIWDESETEFKFITTTSGATVSGDVTIGTYSSVRTGVLSVGTGSRVNSRFLVSSSGGTVSLVVDEFGNVYNRGRGNISTNTAFGESALSLNVGGYENTAIGVNALLSNTTGNYNTALGQQSLYSNTTGSFNVAVGNSSLYNNTTGFQNTAIGYYSLFSNIDGFHNTALGLQSLYSNTTGYSNTALGQESLALNTTGYSNTALGVNALQSNTTGYSNTAVGQQSLYSNIDGFNNTALGLQSLYSNTTGYSNTAIGPGSLGNNQTGSYNIGIGSQAGVYRVSFLGATNSNNSIFIGSDTTSGATTSNATNEIVIGHGAAGNGSNTITLGNNSVVTTYLKGKVQLPTIPTTSTGTYSILTRNDITGEVEKIVAPYKVYTALLTQSGTASPTAIVLENTLGVTITFSYVGVGQYTLTATGALTVNKTWVIFNNVDSNAGTITYNVKSLNGFDILTRSLGGVTTNGILNLTEIEIRVYN